MTSLSSDRPSSDPKDDLFGQAPFAKRLSDSRCRYYGNDGLVLALGRPVSEESNPELGYDYVAKMLDVLDARIVYYDQFITTARETYREYLDKSKNLDQLDSIMGQL